MKTVYETSVVFSSLHTELSMGNIAISGNYKYSRWDY